MVIKRNDFAKVIREFKKNIRTCEKPSSHIFESCLTF